MEIIKVNDYLSFVVEKTAKGNKINCIYDGQSIGKKSPCRHIGCNIKFISEMSIAADQMFRFEKVFEPEENQN